jgi:hypothetical protein
MWMHFKLDRVVLLAMTKEILRHINKKRRPMRSGVFIIQKKKITSSFLPSLFWKERVLLLQVYELLFSF